MLKWQGTVQTLRRLDGWGKQSQIAVFVWKSRMAGNLFQTLILHNHLRIAMLTIYVEGCSLSRGALVIIVRKFGWVDAVRLKKNYRQMYGKLEKSAERLAA